MKPFPRRTYHNIGEVWQDFLTIFTHRSLIRKAMRELLSSSFRERLMMVVTQVNGCRYCSYYHARESLKVGVAIEELQTILKGQIPEDTPDEELPALIYAQHWAESNAHPDPVTVQKLVKTYGQEKADAIHIVLRMIRVGNLLGNTLDAILYYISFGKWGNALIKDSQT
ncbi:MAG: carboxymuconolactone decarboxylase family protein [Anaerolineales bacterium]|nr:carboxymuconolactone decarboxylase family protein [Anaerolineales bacterium]